MSRDKVTDALIDALKLALAGPTEQRLFKSGKLEGLFSGRTGINADAKLGPAICLELTKMTGVTFTSADNLFEGISSQDAAVELSGQLKTLACALMKIANDLRWMNSGPLAGLGEIALPALQPGSKIGRAHV